MNKVNLNKIRTLASERGISLKWIAEKAGISQQAVSAIIKTNNTNVSTLVKIADALEVSVVTFFEPYAESKVDCSGNVGGDFLVNSKKEAGMAIEALIQQLKVKDQQIDRLLKQLSKNK